MHSCRKIDKTRITAYWIEHWCMDTFRSYVDCVAMVAKICDDDDVFQLQVRCARRTATSRTTTAQCTPASACLTARALTTRTAAGPASRVSAS